MCVCACLGLPVSSNFAFPASSLSTRAELSARRTLRGTGTPAGFIRKKKKKKFQEMNLDVKVGSRRSKTLGYQPRVLIIINIVVAHRCSLSKVVPAVYSVC